MKYLVLVKLQKYLAAHY